MLHEVVDDPAAHSPEALREAYEAELRAVVESVGVERVAAESGVDREALERLLAGETVELTLETAAAILATRADVRDAETVAATTRDHLLMGMATGVLDVDTVAANVDLDLDAREVQQALEGRGPMTLAELAAVHRFVAERNDR